MRPFHPAALGVVVLVAAGVLLGTGTSPARPDPASGSVPNAATLTITSSGLLAVNFTFTDPNGSALRFAMDGNFTPLVDGLPVNASTRTTVLGQIATLESSPLLGGFFGNRDGIVSSGEVTLFEGLLHQLTTSVGRAIPSGTLSVSAVASLTLDGGTPSTSTFQTVSFSGAEGPVVSTAPVGISLEFSYQFPVSGSQHTLALAIGGGGLPTSLIVPTAVASVSLTTPAGTTITSVDGLSALSTSSDPWGWGTSTATGDYQLASNTTVAFHYQSSFPSGDVLIGAAATAAVAVAASVLLLRRRRRRRAASAPAPSAEGAPVGPSGSA